MSIQFQGTLHDRNQNTSRPVVVRPEPGVLHIIPEFGPPLEWLELEIGHARSTRDGLVILQNGRQFLEVTEPGFEAALRRSFPDGKLFRGQGFFDRNGLKGCLLILLLLLLPVIAWFLWIAPWIAEKAAQQMEKETESQIGESLYQSMVGAYRIDSTLTYKVQDFYNSLGYKTDYDIRITVVKEPVINAFALPGGRIVVFDGILGIMDSPDQLAALLGHEASHVQLRHSLRGIFREMTNGIALSLLFGNYGDVASVIAREGHKLAGLANSRELELEADDRGLQYMRDAGIDIEGMKQLFSKMKSGVPAETGQIPNFLSTHPSLDERIQRVAGQNAAGTIQPALDSLWRGIKGGR